MKTDREIFYEWNWTNQGKKKYADRIPGWISKGWLKEYPLPVGIHTTIEGRVELNAWSDHLNSESMKSAIREEKTILKDLKKQNRNNTVI